VLPDLSISLLLKDLGVRDERERVLVLQKLTFNTKVSRVKRSTMEAVSR